MLFSCGGAGSSTTTTPPTTATIAPTTSTITTTTTVVTTTTVAPPVYSEEALDYFAEVTFGPEFGGGSQAIRKWTQDMRIAVYGTPNEDDLATLAEVIADLNEIIGTIELEIVESGENVELHFAPEEEFESIEPNYEPVNLGFFWVWWDGTESISNARILISTTELTQAERSHLIREELTQSLGLMNDSFSYEDSIFYQGWTDTGTYSELDEMLIEMLYLPKIGPGMEPGEVLELLGGG